MGYKVIKLQNVSSCDSGNKPTISISIINPLWDECYSAWLSGKNPAHPEWKKGIFALTEEMTYYHVLKWHFWSLYRKAIRSFQCTIKKCAFHSLEKKP